MSILRILIIVLFNFLILKSSRHSSRIIYKICISICMNNIPKYLQYLLYGLLLTTLGTLSLPSAGSFQQRHQTNITSATNPSHSPYLKSAYQGASCFVIACLCKSFKAFSLRSLAQVERCNLFPWCVSARW